jgi:hypothetical protein
MARVPLEPGEAGKENFRMSSLYYDYLASENSSNLTTCNSKMHEPRRAAADCLIGALNAIGK